MLTHVRLKDVAEAAGVDISTASSVLANKPKAARYAEATRERILDAARRLGYQPNAAAKALATRRTGTIGLTLHSEVPRGWANLYFAGQLVGVEEVCRERGYGLQINLYDLNNVESFVFPKQVQQRAVDGVILAGYVRGGIVKRFQEIDVPVVCLGQNHDLHENVPIVSVDHVSKALEAVRYAAAMGHRQIGYCALPTKQKTDVARRVERAVAAAKDLKQVALQIFVQFSHSDTAQSGREMLDQLAALPSDERPTVVIFTTLDVPLGVLREMKVRGLRCPEDLSLIADNNDDDLCDIIEPPLTAMGQDLTLMGRTAATTLIDLLESGGLPQTIAQLPAGPLRVRGSVARLLPLVAAG